MANAETDTLAAFRELLHLADALNARQHSGSAITATMWSALYESCNRSRAVIENAGNKVDEFAALINEARELLCGIDVVGREVYAALIDKAREIYGDDDVVIDDVAFLRRGKTEHDGTWVSAWVFVPDVIPEIED